MNEPEFPAGFLWGTATAAHQVEGGNHNNDWWDWEEGARHIRNGDRSDPACDHYHRFLSDFDLLRNLHQNAHRFSIEWSRIEPSPGEFSPEALGHYRSVLEALRDRGMTPMVTLHHFTNPLWLSRSGGWESDDTPAAFARFVDRVLETMGDLGDLWITLNEPTGMVAQGYVFGEWPPGRQDFSLGIRVLRNLLRGHWLAYERIKARQPTAQVGIAHHLRVFDPASHWSPLDRGVAALYQQIFNNTMLRSLRVGRPVFPLDERRRWGGPPQSQDFIGLNYYTRNRVRFDPGARKELFGYRVTPKGPRSDQGFEIYPEGLYRWLKILGRENRRIHITENGVADQDDRLRPAFLVDHLRAAARALAEGVPLRGYFHWSCFDNFEWAEGYSSRFGLMACDRLTQVRTLKASGRLYAEICRTGRLPPSVEPRSAAARELPASTPPTTG